MAGISSIDIMGSLGDALGSIRRSKVDLSLPETSPFAGQKQQVADSQNMINEIMSLLALDAEKERQKAIGVQQAVAAQSETPARMTTRLSSLL